ncbi:GspH/FimT family pseudopilin [Pelomonas sp. SE-A7]|uniref:GspH/FimT family pseudopilin n=1 Tax=Pelomonas sp. SE-A7 TaxID=3054953 RepID=UPI00259CACF5|nr:GspH/FimT family pseudopilin [Pelomonas sp. SE-A7]MDM4765110.1 GspH/FimT family pseudopilin [Pelomonas sp. SE-A7]
MASPRHSLRGLSLAECLISCVVTCLLLRWALPSLQEMRQRERLRAVAAQVMTDLMQARSEAFRLDTSVQMRFSNHPNGSCYLIFTGPTADCSCSDEGRAVCVREGRLMKLQWIPAQQAAVVRSNVSSMTFSGYRGTVSRTGSIDITSSNGRLGIRHVVSIAGRVRSCSPGGSYRHLSICT